MRISCYSFFTEGEVIYTKPTQAEFERNATRSYGTKYDKVEREFVEGIVPLAFARVTAYDSAVYANAGKDKALDSPVREV